MAYSFDCDVRFDDELAGYLHQNLMARIHDTSVRVKDYLVIFASVDDYLAQREHYQSHGETTDFEQLDSDFVIADGTDSERLAVKLVGEHPVDMNPTMLENTFYNIPVTGTVRVYEDGSEIKAITLDEVNLLDGYSWSKPACLKAFGNYTKELPYRIELMAYLEKNLPDCPV